MADISKELDNFKNAKYGKDVRGSMVSLAEKLNKESSDTVKTVSEYGDAEVSREQAEQDRQNAENARQQDFETMKSDSQAATIAANKAAERAEQAATGDISLKTVTFEVAAARAGIVSGDTLGVAFGKLAKYCTDIEDHAFNALVNNGLANIAGVSALDAVQANPDVADTLAYKIAQNLAAITSLNSNLSNFQSENAKLVIGKVDNGPYMYLINKITNSLLMLRMNEEDKSIAVNAQTNGAWGSEKLLATKDYLGVIQYNGVDYISLSGKLSNIGEWVKNNGTPGKCTFVRVEPSDSDGYFGTSGFSILWTRTSVNYGWCILISDNPKMVVFGRNTVGWNWYAPTLTQVS